MQAQLRYHPKPLLRSSVAQLYCISALLTLGGRVAGIESVYCSTASAPRCIPASSGFAHHFESRFRPPETTDSFVGRFLFFLWYAGWRGVDDSHVARDATTVCKPPVVASPRHSKLMRHPRFFALLTLLFIVHTDLHTLFGCVGWPFRSFSYLCSKRL